MRLNLARLLAVLTLAVVALSGCAHPVTTTDASAVVGVMSPRTAQTDVRCGVSCLAYNP